MPIHTFTPADAIDLPMDEVHVWVAPLDDPYGRDVQRESLFSAEERERAERFMREEPRRRFMAAHAALRSVLSGYLALPPADVPIATGTHGKPRLADGEVADDHRFNLAHSGELALIAVTRGCEVGVDVEQLRPVGHLQEIADRYFTAAESAAISQVGEPERTERFLSTWTAKEAILKAAGRGLSLPLNHCSVTLAANAQWVTLADPHNAPDSAASRWWLQHVKIAGAYVAAVATAEQRTLPPIRHYGEFISR